MSKSFIEESRAGWRSRDSVTPSNEQLILGCLQRIALATEAMAKSHNSLIAENESLKRTLEHRSDWLRRAEGSVRGLRAVITRMKNKKG